MLTLVAGCATPVVTPQPSQSTATTLTPLPSESATTLPIATETPSPELTCAQETLAGMSEAERVGQLFLLGLPNDKLDAATKAGIGADHFGSLWFTATSSIGVTGVRAVADAVQAQATSSNTAGVHFFVAANQEGGLIQALRGTGFSTIPSALTQGGLDPAVLQTDARGWGRQLVKAGVNLDFAPVFDVVPPGTDATNAPIGALKREYGHDPTTAGEHASAFLQGMTDAGVQTSAKHFPGLGRVTGNTDFTGGVVDDVTTAQDPYLDSFRMGIDAGVPFVMVALATYTKIDPDHLAVFSPAIMGLLRDELGFSGVIVSDDLGATAAVADVVPGDRAVQFIEAGGDLIISKTLAPATARAKALRDRAGSDQTFAARVDDSALRVLEAKDAAGLLPCS
jgi:beta-N-acetylhexosaminidase